MNMDLTTINAHIQTDPYSSNFTTSSIMNTSTSDIINAASAPTIIESTVLSNVVNNDSIELPYYRLSRSNQSCSICKINFSQKHRNCEYISEKIRAECLIIHKIFIPDKSRCCTSHICDDSLPEKDIEKIKNSTTKHCSIKQHELIEIFSLMKIMLQNLQTKLENIEKKPVLCFDADSTFNASNYYVLTGLTLEQFDNLCSKIPSGVIRNSDLRSSQSVIACLLVKLRLGLNNDVLATLFGFRNRRDVGHVLDSDDRHS